MAFRREKSTYLVTIDAVEQIDLFERVSGWLLEQVPPRDQRAVSLRHNRMSDSVFTTYDAHRPVPITIAGHDVTMWIERSSAEGFMSSPDKLVLSVKSVAAQAAVIEKIREIDEQAREKTPDLPYLNIMSSAFSGWERVGYLQPRPLSSVVLQDGQAERIREDLMRFMTREKDYIARGIPWHRGYMFHGPPGTGKTSVARALASDLNLNVWYAPLGDLKQDAQLTKVVGRIELDSPAILLLEDVDVFAAMQTRSDTGSRGELSLSGILNTLDGVATPHGLITIMTTNNLDMIDPAVLRSGRVDFMEHFGLPTAEQAARLFEVFYGAAPSVKIEPDGRSTADLVELFKRNMDDPDGALFDLCFDELAK